MAIADCCPCHFDYEEEHAFPYLPENVRMHIKLEHDMLRREGFPAQKVLEHAEREMVYFRFYCPPEIVARIDAEHENLTPGLKAQMNQATPASNHTRTW